MAWRVAKVSGSLTAPSANSWRIARIAGSSGSTWQVARISGQSINIPPTWKVARIRGVVTFGWRLARIAGVIGTEPIPAVTALPNAYVDPVTPVTITATTSNGVVPDSWSFVASAGAITAVGNVATLVPPGTLDGGPIVVTITATRGAYTSSAVVVTYTVRKGTVFRVVNGAYVATSPFQTIS